jgi:Glycosyltransferase family 87
MSAALTRPSVRVQGLVTVGRRAAQWLIFAALPLLIVGATLIVGFHKGTGAWALDFNGNFVIPAKDILHGVSPYHPAYLERVRDAVAAGRRSDEFSHGVFATYPPPALLIGVPFTFLPAAVAEWLWVGLMVASAALALRLVGVRDWRVYGAALLTPALGTSLSYGTVNCALMLGLAALWRWRDHAWRGGLALGALIALKLIFLPLLAWLVFTRRWLCAALACLSAAALCAVGWAVIGFDGLAGYPHLLGVLADIERAQGFSSGSYALSLGLSAGIATAVPYVLGACVTALMWIALRRGGPQADAHGFLLATAALIAFSPIVWLHYLVLLLVPLAVLRPRLSVAWLMPSLMWVMPFAAYTPANPVHRTVFLAALTGTVVFALGPRQFAALFGGFRRRRAGTIPEWR